jgi:maltose/moltooligosaccharide transporter
MRSNSKKEKLTFFQIWNMSFGFLGIQFGFALQGGFMSRIFQNLGAGEEEIPMLWIAAPLTGLIIQPIIGYLSDNTWSPKFGRRRPYFLIGAIFASLTLFFIPHSPALWVAAGGLWVLDASINISMEPFRALVADKLPISQRSYGFVTQTLIIGVDTWVASSLPLIINKMGVTNLSQPGGIPLSVKMAFSVGAFVFLISILYTVLTTSEEPPENIAEFKKERRKKLKISQIASELIGNIWNMPMTMKKLGLIQFFSWFAFFSMWALAIPALTEHVYDAPKPEQIIWANSSESEKIIYQDADKSYNNAADQVGAQMGYYGLSSMFFCIIINFLHFKEID